MSKPQGAWPSTTVTWAAWVDRMEKFFGQEWKALGIYDTIKLTTTEIVMDRELLMAALSFWCSATNTMVLPLGPIGPTILDVSAILGTSPSGFPIDAALLGCSSNVDLKALFEARAVETLSRDGQEPSKEEVQKLHKNFFNYRPLSPTSPAEGMRVSTRGNMQLSCSIGTTNSFVVPNRINAWSRICLWPRL